MSLAAPPPRRAPPPPPPSSPFPHHAPRTRPHVVFQQRAACRRAAQPRLAESARLWTHPTQPLRRRRGQVGVDPAHGALLGATVPAGAADALIGKYSAVIWTYSAVIWMYSSVPPLRSLPPPRALVFSPSKLMSSSSTAIYRFLANAMQASSFLASYCALGSL
jgi:hypothetical protein